MPLYSWLLTSLLVSQGSGIPPLPLTAPPTATNPPAVNARGPAIPAAPFPARPAGDGAFPHEPAALPAQTNQPPANPIRATSAQLAADALTLPPGSALSGHAVSLLAVVVTVPERQRQIEAVHAYWRLAEAVADYHFCYERQQRLARLKAGNDEAADLRTAEAIAAAQIREAELQVTTAQHDLAEILLLLPGTPLPLPADQPLVGPYRTLFAELFSGKKAPETARTLDQTLPLRNRAIESHAAALLAAEDALDAALELQTSGQGHLAGILAALDVQVHQQTVFMAAVCRYNHDIANYAQVAVAPQTTPELLVGTLIKQNRPVGQPVMPLPTTATVPASYQQPSVASPAAASVIPNLPTRPGHAGSISAQSPEMPIPVRVEETAPATSSPPATSPIPQRSNEPQEPRLAPPQESAIPLVPEQAPASSPPQAPAAPSVQEKSAGSSPMVGEAKSPDGLTTRTSRKPIGESTAPRATALETYPGLAGLAPAERIVKFTTALYWNRNLPSPAGQPVRLINCLRSAPLNRRADVMETYWKARQIAVQYQSFVEQIQWLEALGPTLSSQNPPSPMAMLKVRVARLSVEAERADVETEWRVAQFQLADLAGLEAEKVLPQPSSVPFVGRFQLPASLPQSSWPQRRLNATIPLWEQSIIDQAAAVVETDASRAAATADFLAGRSSVDRVLASIEVQARETSVFLRDVTEYNQTISCYALATLPKNAAAETVAAALMVE